MRKLNHAVGLRGRLFALVGSAAATFATLGGAWAESSDPFSGSRNFDTAAPQATAPIDGDQGVVEQRGAVTYAYPIALPPGRGGAAPAISLGYSSQGSLRGGVAVGWEL